MEGLARRDPPDPKTSRRTPLRSTSKSRGSSDAGAYTPPETGSRTSHLRGAPPCTAPAMSWAAGTAFDPPGGGAVVASPQQTSPSSETDTQRKRKHSSISTPNGDLDGSSSPSTSKRHQPGVKRACNDCRQQKVCQITLPVPPSSAPCRLFVSIDSRSIVVYLLTSLLCDSYDATSMPDPRTSLAHAA